MMLTPVTRPPPSSKDRVAPTGRSLRILVVDDNVDSAQSLGLLLEESGHDVQTAYDGLTALETARNYRPNVVLLDIGLPGIDGFEVATGLRQQPGLSGVVLVALTGYGQATDMPEPFAGGAGLITTLVQARQPCQGAANLGDRPGKGDLDSEAWKSEPIPGSRES